MAGAFHACPSILLLLLIGEFHLPDCIHYLLAFVSAHIGSFQCDSIFHMLTLLGENPVRESQAASFEPSVGQIFEKVADDWCAWASSFIGDNVEELFELNHTRAVLIHHFDQLLHLFIWVYEAKAYERTTDFFRSDRSGSIIVQAIKAFLQAANLSTNT